VRAASRAAWIALWAANLLSCESSGQKPSPGPVASSKPSSTPLLKSAAVASAAPQRPPRGCRVVGLTGRIERLAGEPLRPSELFDGASWLTFAEGSSATFRHSESTREWTLVGPGRMRPCRGREEQVGVASGKVRTTAGAGARPGAEVTIFTPHGVVRYGDATLTLVVDPRRLSTQPSSGEVWLETFDGKPASKALPAGKPTITARKSDKPSLEQRCEALAQRAAELGRTLASSAGGARNELSTRAVDHLKARREARFVCGAGEALAASLEEPERGRLLDRFATWERLYRELPSRAAAPNP
jgi:hypothetical protein